MGIKFNCSNPACRQRLEVDEALAGSSMKCPACAKELHIPESKDIRFNCMNSGCGQHLVVDVSEAGRFIKCPSCGAASRVPGDPPKSIVSERPKSAGRARLSSSPMWKVPPPAPLTPAKRLLRGWALGAALFAILLWGMSLRTRLLLPGHSFEAQAEETYYGNMKDTLVEDQFGTGLFYLEVAGVDLNVFRVDRATFKRTHLLRIKGAFREKGMVKNLNFQWFGWSPDKRVLAYFTRQAKNYCELRLCNGETGKAKGATNISSCGIMKDGVWLNTNSLVLLNRRQGLFLFNLAADPALGQFGRAGIVKLRDLRGKDGHACLTPDSEHSIAYVQQGNVWTLDIPSGRETQLTRLDKGTPRKLSYSPQNEMYLLTLFNSKQDGDSFVWQLGPRFGRKVTLTRMTDEHSAYGMWIQEGRGYAFIKPAKDSESLAIEPENMTTRTNLLAGSRIASFCVGKGGERVYVVAEDCQQVKHIWEYDLETKSLREIVLKAPAVLASVTNVNQEKVDYYCVLPIGMNPRKKYPVVLDVLSGNQYGTAGQMFAQAGMFFVSVSQFEASRKWDSMPGSEDILAVYREILKHPNVDRGRVYILGNSFSTTGVASLVNAHPEMWHGALFTSPSALPSIPPHPPSFPRLFISKGALDHTGGFDYRNPQEPLILDACRNLIPLKVDVQQAGHGYKTEQLMESYKAIVKFILTE